MTHLYLSLRWPLRGEQWLLYPIGTARVHGVFLFASVFWKSHNAWIVIDNVLFNLTM